MNVTSLKSLGAVLSLRVFSINVFSFESFESLVHESFVTFFQVRCDFKNRTKMKKTTWPWKRKVVTRWQLWCSKSCFLGCLLQFKKNG